jgi:5'-3' exonuclease
MGIPAYMSFIIKNYANIIHSRWNIPSLLNCLYMDCNSIIYDVFNHILKEGGDIQEEEIIKDVILKIETYLLLIKPTDVLMIAFDGVAPFSKMEQQRLRRYKAWHSSTFSLNNDLSSKTTWSTSSITPGTEFMNQLSKKIKSFYEGSEMKYGIRKIIVSGSDEVGEGEQKIFQYIRNHPDDHIEKNVLVYGLDSDLIMLSIFNCNRCKNIYVFREEMEFKSVKHVNPKKPGELLFLDIGRLSESILIEMIPPTAESLNRTMETKAPSSSKMTGNTAEKNRLYDYLILCFFLGNDFLPHFPSLNIRTNGIHILIDTYKQVIGKYADRSFVSKDGKIQWKWLKLVIEQIAKNEKQMFLTEYNVRDKMDHYKWPQTTVEEKENVIHNTPVIFRAEEKYICPSEYKWEERYYKILFEKERTQQNIEKISTNFLEGIEWVFKYYTQDCPDWKWKYHYNYPPLMVDLMKYIPEKEIDFISAHPTSKIPFTPSLQLSYVLPEKNHYLMGEKKKEFLKKNYLCLFPKELKYQWAFCRYFFESHLLLPEISIGTLEKLERELVVL